MKKISIFAHLAFSEEQLRRLQAVGEVKKVSVPASAEEWTALSESSDVICTDGSGLLENLPHLRDVLVTYPFIELGSFDSEELKKRGVFVANTRGSNRDSIVEWTMYMILSLFRQFHRKMRVTESFPFELNHSLHRKTVLIVGKGDIGSQIGTLCEAFGMKVDFFLRGDNLLEKSKDKDLIVNSLNCNSSSKNLLDKTFFMSLKPGSYYVSFARPFTYDLRALLKSIDQTILAGAAIDCDPEESGDVHNDFYQTCLNNEKILVTPHIAFATEEAKQNALEIVVRNVEAFAAGRPINILTKR